MAAAAAAADNAVIFLILRYLEDRNLFRTCHALERESGIYFNMKYFEDLIQSGNLDEAEYYLKGFTSFDQNPFSTKVFFIIRQLKFLEVVQNGAISSAHEIAENELRCFDPFDTRIYERARQVLSMEDPREHLYIKEFQREGGRKFVAHQSRVCITKNPVFRGKLEFPPLITILQQLFANGSQPAPHSPEAMMLFPLITNYFISSSNANSNHNSNSAGSSNNNTGNGNGDRNNGGGLV